MEQQKRLTICDRLEQFLRGKKGMIATLKEIYSVISDYPQESIRTSIYRDMEIRDRFERHPSVAGVYMLKDPNRPDVSGILLEGDGRKLQEIEDSSVQLIVTDHPWSDPKKHRSGNQKAFSADYEDTCFRYNQEDFNQKARVLEEGGYLAEFIPVESDSNWEYLYEIKKMAQKAGLEYYAKVTWCKAPENTIFNGRTTKGLEDIIIFTKGKPKRLAPKGKPYYTTRMLNSRIEIPAPKPKEKIHQAEKPVELFEYLIELLSEEGSVVVDQFGGSCNCLRAAVNKNRFAVVYEYLSKFVDSAVERFKAIPLYNRRKVISSSSESVKGCSDETEQEVACAVIKSIDKKVDQVFNAVSEKVGEREILQLQLSF